MWDTSSRLISWGWTPSLQLVCVESGGMVVVRALTGEKIKEVSFGAAVAGQGVVHAHLDGSVVIVITSSGEIWVMPDVDSPRPMRLPSPPVAADVLATCCLAVQQPQQTVSGMLQVNFTCNTCLRTTVEPSFNPCTDCFEFQFEF